MARVFFVERHSLRRLPSKRLPLRRVMDRRLIFETSDRIIFVFEAIFFQIYFFTFFAYITNLICIQNLINNKFCVQLLTKCPSCINFWFRKAKKANF